MFATGELITDQFPSTPSRTLPVQFGTCILTSALSGAAIAAPGRSLALGAIAGVVGAVIGTLEWPGGARMSGQDARQRPARGVARGRGGNWRAALIVAMLP